MYKDVYIGLAHDKAFDFDKKAIGMAICLRCFMERTSRMNIWREAM